MNSKVSKKKPEPKTDTSNLSAAAQEVTLLLCRVLEPSGMIRETFSDKAGNIVFSRLLKEVSDG